MEYHYAPDGATSSYPDHPGYRANAPETSKAAADAIAPMARSLRDRVLTVLQRAYPETRSSDQIAQAIGITHYSVRPRVSELVAGGKVERTDDHEKRGRPDRRSLEGLRMNKAVTPKQLELTAGKTRDELLTATLPPHIDPESPAFKADMAKVDKIEMAEAARAVVNPPVNPPDKPSGARDWSDPDDDRFDWRTDDSVILREQRATAAYFNKEGELIVRQRGWPDDDTFLFVAPEYITEFLEGVAKQARERE